MYTPTTSGTIESVTQAGFGSNYQYRRRKFLKFFSKTTQFLAGPIISFTFRLFFRVEILGQENLKMISSPLIIISNHISFFDSFIFRLVLKGYTSFLPLRFMAVKKFNSKYLNFLAKIGLIEIIYAIFGVFTIKRGLGISKNLEEANKILADKGNLVIYPEGEIFQSANNIGIFRIGAAVLAQKTGASVLPVAMKITKKSHFRRKFTVNIGKRIVINKDISVPSHSITTNFHDEILELYKQI